MAIRPPPILESPIFNSAFFRSLDEPITIAEGDGRYLLWPVSQGDETINGDLTTIGGTTVGTTLLTDDIQSNTGNMTIATTQIGGSLLIGTEPNRTGEIRIGASTAIGAGRTINIGTTGSSGTNPVNIAGSSITVGSANTSTLTVNPNATSALNLGSNMTGGTLTIGGTVGGTTAINIGNGASQGGAISIGGGAIAKNITIGSGAGGTTLIRGGVITLNTGTTGVITLGNNTTGGTNLGQSLTTGDLTIGGLQTTGNMFIGQSSVGSSNAVSIANSSAGTTNVNIGKSNAFRYVSGTNDYIEAQRPLRLTAGSTAIQTSGSTTLGFFETRVSSTGSFPAPPSSGANSQTGSGVVATGSGVFFINFKNAIDSSVSINPTVIISGVSTSTGTGNNDTTALLGSLYMNDDSQTLSTGNYIYSGGFMVRQTATTTYYPFFKMNYTAGTATWAFEIESIKIA